MSRGKIATVRPVEGKWDQEGDSEALKDESFEYFFFFIVSEIWWDINLDVDIANFWWISDDVYLVNFILSGQLIEN